MFYSLHNLLSIKKEVKLTTYNQQSSRYEIIAGLYSLLNKLTEDQRFSLLKLLIQDKSTEYLLKLIIDLSDNQKLVLMNQLEEITSKPAKYDRRKYPRKDCLIHARMSVKGRINSCFILDISPYGAFIDTSDGFSLGQSAKLAFSSPDNGKHLILTCEFVWSEKQGVGLKFNHLTPKQLNSIRTFAENKQTVYEINS